MRLLAASDWPSMQCVDLQQDGDAVSGPAGGLVASTPEFSHSETAAWRRS